MTIIREQDAPRFGQDGVEVTGLASPSRGCDTVSAWRVLLAPGAASPEHTLTSDEASSRCAAARGWSSRARPSELRAGDCLVVAPDRRFTHPQRRRGALRSRLLHGRRRAGGGRGRGLVRAALGGLSAPSQRAGACTRAGVPSARAPGGTSWVTTARTPTRAPAPDGDAAQHAGGGADDGALADRPPAR